MNFNNMESLNGRVLLATADPTLRATRTALLRRFGLNAVASVSAEDAINLIRSTAFDLLVLGNTLSPEECSAISRAFKQFRPHGRIIEIVPASGDDCKDSPHATVVGLDGPQALHRVVQEQIEYARA